jgi:hypothetical protein
MAKKNKIAKKANGKKDTFKMIFLAWLLTLLAVPVVGSLVPAYFDPQSEQVLSPDGDIAWLLVVNNILTFIIPFLFATLVIPAIASLVCKKEFPGVFIGSLKRYLFLLSTTINILMILFFLFDLLITAVY